MEDIARTKSDLARVQSSTGALRELFLRCLLIPLRDRAQTIAGQKKISILAFRRYLGANFMMKAPHSFALTQMDIFKALLKTSAIDFTV